MSNIIDNQLKVGGPRETLELFKNSFVVINSDGKVEDLDLSLFFHVPQNLKSDTATEKQKKIGSEIQSFTRDITEICYVDEDANYIPYLKESENSDIYTFTNRWRGGKGSIGPISSVQNISTLYVGLNFSLISCDISNDYAEIYEISNGEITSSKSESGIED